MRSLTPLAVFVVAILATESRIWADQSEVSDSEPSVIYEPMPLDGGINGFDQYRQMPDDGAPGSAAFGFKHFVFPFHSYTTWYRPRASTLTPPQRCAPVAFRPRGFGNLFARPCDSFRMEYQPHTLTGDHTEYGPVYINRQPDPSCVHCVK